MNQPPPPQVAQGSTTGIAILLSGIALLLFVLIYRLGLLPIAEEMWCGVRDGLQDAQNEPECFYIKTGKEIR